MSALDLLALAPLPCRSNGRVAYQVGATLQCASLLRGLAERGHRVHVISTHPPEPADLQPGDLGPEVSVDWFAVEMLSTRRPPDDDEVRRRRTEFEVALDRVLADRRPDLVILGNESHPWYAADVCRERGLTSVLVAQGVPTAGIPAGIYPPAALQVLLEHLRKVDLIVAVSGHLEAVLRELGLKRVCTIETGTDTDAFRSRPKDPGLLETHKIAPDRFVIGSFAHMRPEKRVSDLVGSAEIVLRSDPRILYLVVGDGPLRGELLELVDDKGLGEDFRFVGELSHQSVPHHMALCDAVVVASEREGQPLVCREAQASGCVLIASDIPAGRAAAADGKAGLLFRLGDVEDLAAKTLALASDETLRRSLAAKGRAAAVANSGDVWIDAWSETLTAMKTIARGGMNQLALTGHGARLAVRKRYTASDTRRRKSFGSGARNEALLGARLGDLIPAELSAETSDDREDVYLAWRHGTPLEPGEIAGERARAAGATLARIHAVTDGWYGSIDGRYRYESQAAAFARRWPRAITALEGVDPKLAAVLDQWARPRLPRISWSRPTLVHGDFGVTNLLWTGSEVSTVLDWEYARFGDPREDWSKVTIGTRFAEPNSFGLGEGVLGSLRRGYLSEGGAAESMRSVALYDAYYAAVVGAALESASHLGWLWDLSRV